jgi:hypothetical protein
MPAGLAKICADASGAEPMVPERCTREKTLLLAGARGVLNARRDTPAPAA